MEASTNERAYVGEVFESETDFVVEEPAGKDRRLETLLALVRARLALAQGS